jgi:hypothetical protein
MWTIHYLNRSAPLLVGGAHCVTPSCNASDWLAGSPSFPPALRRSVVCLLWSPVRRGWWLCWLPVRSLVRSQAWALCWLAGSAAATFRALRSFVWWRPGSGWPNPAVFLDRCLVPAGGTLGEKDAMLAQERRAEGKNRTLALAPFRV